MDYPGPGRVHRLSRTEFYPQHLPRATSVLRTNQLCRTMAPKAKDSTRIKAHAAGPRRRGAGSSRGTHPGESPSAMSTCTVVLRGLISTACSRNRTDTRLRANPRCRNVCLGFRGYGSVGGGVTALWVLSLAAEKGYARKFIL